MAQSKISYIDMRFAVHATEDVDKVYERAIQQFTQRVEMNADEFNQAVYDFMQGLQNEFNINVNHPYLQGINSNPFKFLYRPRLLVSSDNGLVKVHNSDIVSQYSNNLNSIKKILGIK